MEDPRREEYVHALTARKAMAASKGRSEQGPPRSSEPTQQNLAAAWLPYGNRRSRRDHQVQVGPCLTWSSALVGVSSRGSFRDETAYGMTWHMPMARTFRRR
jgi:hypothetical protein